MNGDSSVLLEAHDLVCGYPGYPPVLEEVSLSLAAGRFVCVIGPNGIGKSTLMQTLSGLLPALSGSIALDGRSLASHNSRERARVLSVVLTGQHYPGYMTVRRYVELGRYPHLSLLGKITEADSHAVTSALETVGALHLHTRRVAELSDGERQRVSLARALAQSSKLMLLDEPTAFLDVSGRAHTMATLQSAAHTTGRLIITSSHDIELVLRTADTVILIRPDRTLVTGAPEDLVLERELEQLFNSSSLRFDYERGRFALSPIEGPVAAVSGDGPVAVWTRNVLERVGYTIAESAPVTVYSPTAADGTWRVRTADNTEHVLDSLGELADLLRH
jgi:iron complex transport system ATP-binding protein